MTCWPAVAVERCQSHAYGMGRGVTRHPKLGAAQQLLLLYRNHQEISDLENLRRCGAPEVPTGELVENKAQRLKEKINQR